MTNNETQASGRGISPAVSSFAGTRDRNKGWIYLRLDGEIHRRAPDGAQSLSAPDDRPEQSKIHSILLIPQMGESRLPVFRQAQRLGVGHLHQRETLAARDENDGRVFI